MIMPRHGRTDARIDGGAGWPRHLVAWLAVLLPLASGCSALHPLNGIPVNYYPRELQSETRSGKRTIDLSLLRQTPPEHYLLDTGDVLGVYIEGVLGKREEVPPVHFPQTGETPPSLGYPIPVREDGTVSLPLTKPILVRGLTLTQVEENIRKAYTEDKQILQAGQDRILVSLQRPRSYNILVIRQETEGGGVTPMSGMNGTINPGFAKRGTGKLVALPAYHNDVLHALAETGGLPGLDAENTIFVIRRRKDVALRESQTRVPGIAPGPLGAAAGHSPPAADQAQSYQGRGKVQQLSGATGPGIGGGHSLARPAQFETPPPAVTSPGANVTGADPAGAYPAGSAAPGGPYPGQPMNGGPQAFANGFPPVGNVNTTDLLQMYGRDSQIVRIPVRLHPAEMPQFREADIILQDGDIVFIESRDTEIFYTGGLLGGGQYTLPRDYDLDVLGAISVASARMGGSSGGGSGGFGSRMGGVSAMNQDISVSASDVVILRQMPNGSQIPIKLDLNKAMRDPKYRIRIQAGDYIVLQYKPMEAVFAFIERNLLAGSIIGLAASNSQGGGFY